MPGLHGLTINRISASAQVGAALLTPGEEPDQETQQEDARAQEKPVKRPVLPEIK